MDNDQDQNYPQHPAGADNSAAPPPPPLPGQPPATPTSPEPVTGSVTPPSPTPPPVADPDKPHFASYEFPSAYRPTPPASVIQPPLPPELPQAPEQVIEQASPVSPPPIPTPEVPTETQPPPPQIPSIPTDGAPIQPSEFLPPTPAPEPTTWPQPPPPGAPPQPAPLPPKQITPPPAVPPQSPPAPPSAEPSVVSYSPTPGEQPVVAPVEQPPTQPANVVGKLNRWTNHLKKHAQKVDRKQLKSRMKPIFSALLIGAVTFGIFNSQLILGQIQYLISPGANAGGEAFVDPGQAAGNKPEIIIPKINLRAPVVYDIQTFNEKEVQKGLERGVVHYGTTGVPGEVGNNVIVGHSSNNWWAGGKYKFAFVLLNKLAEGDTFFLHYGGKRYTYEVVNKKIVAPNDVHIINQNVGEPIATLVTCDPPGTSWKRLVVQGKQIDPDPSKATHANSRAPDHLDTPLPGYGESILDKLKNLF